MSDTPNDQPTSDVPLPDAGMTARFARMLREHDNSPLERPGDEIGPYKLLSLIGEGGFGSVWIAERRDPFVQRVALKLIKSGMDSKAVIARFEQERQAMAVMSHPNIAKVLDGGLTKQGRPYFAMEHVKGEPITDFCDARRLGINDRLQLFTQVCDAIQHAHVKGIVHRDIKPSNVLAFESEGEGLRLKVIDFGVAKAMHHTLTDKTIFTETGQMVGTPAYMSPEQAESGTSDVDTRSDVYSLGVLLYELIAGATPFDPMELRAKAYGEVQRTIREDDPPTPSARLSTISTKNAELASRIERSRGLAIRELAQQLRRELEWIPLKAMRKERQNRYQSATALAEDIRNYLCGRPLIAAPESSGYRLRKYMRRNKALVIGAGTVVLALSIGFVLATWQWWRAEVNAQDSTRQRKVANEMARQAERERRRLESVSSVMLGASAAAQADRNDWRSYADTVGLMLERDLFGSISARLARARAEKWNFGPWHPEAIQLSAVIPLPSSRRLLTVGSRSARLWDEQYQETGEVISHSVGLVSASAISGDDLLLVVGGLYGELVGLDLSSSPPKEAALGSFESSIRVLAINPQRTVLAVGLDDGSLLTKSLIPSEKPLVLEFRHGPAVTCVSFSSDGNLIAAGRESGEVSLHGLSTSNASSRSLGDGVFSVVALSFVDEDRRLAVARDDGSVELWDVNGGAHRVVRPPVSGTTTAAYISRDFGVVALGSREGDLELLRFDFETMDTDLRRVHESGMESIVPVPWSGELLSLSSDGTVFVWPDPREFDQLQEIPLEDPLLDVSISTDGTRLLALCGASVRVFDTLCGGQLGVRYELTRWAESVCFSSDRSRLYATGYRGAIESVDTMLGDKPSRQNVKGGRSRIIAHVDGTVVASPNPFELTVMRPDESGELRDLRQSTSLSYGVLCLAMDGRHALSLQNDGLVFGELPSISDGTQSLETEGRWRRWLECFQFMRDEGHVGVVVVDPKLVFDLRLQKLEWQELDLSGEIATLVDSGPLPNGLGSVVFSPGGETLVGVVSRDEVREIVPSTIGWPGVVLTRGAEKVDVAADWSCFVAGGRGTCTIHPLTPLRDRFEQLKQQKSLKASAAALLKSRLSNASGERSKLRELQRAVLAEPDFSGALRVPALLLIGEEDQAIGWIEGLSRRARTLRDFGAGILLEDNGSMDQFASAVHRRCVQSGWSDCTKRKALVGLIEFYSLRDKLQPKAKYGEKVGLLKAQLEAMEDSHPASNSESTK